MNNSASTSKIMTHSDFIPQFKLIELYSQKLKDLDVKDAFPEGYYLITEIITYQPHTNWTELIVAAKWRPLDESYSSASYPITVHMKNLFHRESKGPKEIDPRAQVGSAIKVNKIEKFEYEWDGNIKTAFKVHWELIPACNAYSAKSSSIITSNITALRGF